MPTEVVFAPGAFKALGEHCARLGQKPLLVTGKHAARTTGMLERACAQLPDVVVFDDVEENPTVTTCETGAALCREQACDCVVALGGGSAMDAAKGIAVLACNPKPGINYFGNEQFKQGALPILAIPTTAGTGSEVTPYAVLVDPSQPAKRTISGRALFPRITLLDPELAVTMPSAVTIATGLDALSQAMEGMLSLKSTPIGDLWAMEVCRLVRYWLPRAVNDPNDLNARGAMAHAAMLSGCIIAHTGTTLVHGMGYYYTLEFGIAHGLANALLLSPVFEYNARHEPQRVQALARALGVSEGEPAKAVHQGLHQLLQTLGVSAAAKEWGVKKQRLRWCAEDIHSDAYRFKNQVGDLSVDDVHQLYLASYSGVSIR